MKILKTLGAACLGGTLFFSGAAHADPLGCDAGEIVIKFSHVTNAERHPKGIAALLLAKRVNAEMDGNMCMEVFPNSILYTDEQVVEAMLRGDVQMAAPSLSLFESISKAYRLFDLPFLFKDLQAVDAFQASATGQKMLDRMQRRGLQGLAYWHNGMKHISAQKPLLRPDDAAGLTFRVQPSEVLVSQMRALKASPQPMAFAEVYGALQTGVVDGQENTWSNIYGKKFFEVQDGITESNHGILDYMVVVAIDFLNTLDDQTKGQFLAILDEVTQERNAEAERVNQSAKQAIIDAGGVVRQLSDEQRAAWVTAMKPVWAEFVDEIGADNIEAARAFSLR